MGRSYVLLVALALALPLSEAGIGLRRIFGVTETVSDKELEGSASEPEPSKQSQGAVISLPPLPQLPSLPPLPQLPGLPPLPGNNRVKITATKTLYVEVTKKVFRHAVCMKVHGVLPPCLPHHHYHRNDEDSSCRQGDDTFDDEEEGLYIRPSRAIPIAATAAPSSGIAAPNVLPSEREARYLEIKNKATPAAPVAVEATESEVADSSELDSHPRLLENLIRPADTHIYTKTLWVTKVEKVIDHRVTATLKVQNCIPVDSSIPFCHDKYDSEHYHHGHHDDDEDDHHHGDHHHSYHDEDHHAHHGEHHDHDDEHSHGSHYNSHHDGEHGYHHEGHHYNHHDGDHDDDESYTHDGDHHHYSSHGHHSHDDHEEYDRGNKDGANTPFYYGQHSSNKPSSSGSSHWASSESGNKHTFSSSSSKPSSGSDSGNKYSSGNKHSSSSSGNKHSSSGSGNKHSSSGSGNKHSSSDSSSKPSAGSPIHHSSSGSSNHPSNIDAEKLQFFLNNYHANKFSHDGAAFSDHSGFTSGKPASSDSSYHGEHTSVKPGSHGVVSHEHTSISSGKPDQHDDGAHFSSALNSGANGHGVYLSFSQEHDGHTGLYLPSHATSSYPKDDGEVESRAAPEEAAEPVADEPKKE